MLTVWFWTAAVEDIDAKAIQTRVDLDFALGPGAEGSEGVKLVAEK